MRLRKVVMVFQNHVESCAWFELKEEKDDIILLNFFTGKCYYVLIFNWYKSISFKQSYKFIYNYFIINYIFLNECMKKSILLIKWYKFRVVKN